MREIKKKKEEREREGRDGKQQAWVRLFQAHVQAYCQLSVRAWIGLGPDLGFIYLF